MKDFSTTLVKIKSRGYWRVEIFPKDYVDEAITLPEIFNTISELSISYRGWDYPHITRDNMPNRQESYAKDNSFIESWIDWSNHKEVWRMHKQGKFVHLFAINEHWFDEFESFFGVPAPKVGQGQIDVVGIVYKVTEVVEFFFKLAQELNQQEYALKVQIMNVRDNTLTVLDSGRMPLDSSYRNRSENVVGYDGQLSVESIADKDARLTFSSNIIQTMLSHFDSWSWTKEAIRTEQEKLIERRL